MAALGRWTSVDPIAGFPGERHPQWSPYAYVLDNPLALVDPDGRQVRAGGWYLPTESGVPIHNEQVTSQADLVRRGLSGAQYLGESFLAMNGFGEQRFYGPDGIQTQSVQLDPITVTASTGQQGSILVGGVVGGAGVPLAVQSDLLNAAMKNAGANAGRGAEILTRSTSLASTGATVLSGIVSSFQNIVAPISAGTLPSARQGLTFTADIGLGILSTAGGAPGAIAAFGIDVSGVKQAGINAVVNELDSIQLLLQKYDDQTDR